MEIKCKKCNKILAENEYKDVGQWQFCLDCFQRLLEGPQKQSPEEHEKADSDVQEERVQESDEKPKCHICNKEIEGNNYNKLGDWKLCPACFSNISLHPPRVDVSCDVELDKEEKPKEEEKNAQFAGKIMVGVPGNKQCQGCNRRLIEGAYKTVDGAPFCPDCYYMLLEITQKEREQQKKKPHTDMAKTEETIPIPNELKICQSCLRSLPDAILKIVDGFIICHGCLSSDYESALQIARYRHRQYLQKLRKELESGL